MRYVLGCRVLTLFLLVLALTAGGAAATAFEDPTSDVQTGWLCVGGSCATGEYTAIDDGTRQPNVPDTADYIYNPAGSSSISEVRFPTVLYDPSSIRLWVYASTPKNQGFNFNLHEDFYRCGTYVSSQTAAWFSCTWNGIDPGNELSDLRARFEGCSGGGQAQCRVYAAYLEITYTASPPNVTYNAPTPVNGSVQYEEYAYISATATDDLTVGSCTLQFDGVNTTMVKTGTGTATCTLNMTGLSEGQHTFRVFATDGTGQVGAAEQRTFTVDRTAPTVGTPSFTDYPDRHAFNVSAVVTDPNIAGGSCTVHADDGGGNTYSFAGALDEGYGTASEALCTYSTINDSLTGFEPTESISVKVSAEDVVGNRGNSTVAAHTIPNRPPGTPLAPQLDVPDLDFVTEHHPNVTWTDAGDVEGDSYNVSIYVQEEGEPSVLEATVPAPGTISVIGETVQLVQGRDYNVTLQACDAWDCSALTAPISFHVNDFPHINAVDLNGTTQTPQTEINIEANVTDLEGTLQWVRFTVWNETAGTRLMFEQNGTQTGDIWTSPPFTTAESGTTYNYTVTAYDGYEYAMPVTGAFDVGNLAPVVVSGPTFTDYPDRHAFNVSAVVNDTSDTELTNYTITLDDTDGNVYSFTRDLDRSFGDQYQAAANFSNVSLHLTGFEPGEVIHVTMTFRDTSGDATPTSGASHTLPNRNPVVTGVAVQPQSPTTADNLSFVVNVTDAEGDPVTCNDVTWFRDGATVSAQSTVTDDLTAKGEQWLVQVRCIDGYGGLAAPVNSSPVTIQNSPVTLVDPITAVNVSGEHAVRFTTTVQDEDGLSDLACSFHYGNQSHWYAGNASLTVGPGFNDTAVCRGTVKAGERSWIGVGTRVNGSLEVTDGSVTVQQGNESGTVPNRLPVVTLLSPPEDTSLTSNDVSFIWTGSDPEGDALNYTFRLYRDGTLVEATAAGTSLSRTLTTGSYTWNVLVSDRYGNRTLSTRASATRSFTIGSPATNDGGGGGGPRDLTPPQITDLTTEERFKPGEVATIRFAVSDASPVTVGAEYFADGTWHAMQVTAEGNGRYRVSFVPETEDVYTVRIVARDAGGRESTMERVITAGFEPSWTRTPVRLNREVGAVGERLTFDPIELENTGDTPVTVDVAVSTVSDRLRVEVPDNVTVPAGATHRFAPVASLPEGAPAGVYPFQVIMTSDEPGQRLVTDSTAVFTSSGPLITFEIEKEFIEGLEAGQRNVSIPVRATNVGTAAADNVWVGLEVPQGWRVHGSSNVSIGRLAVNASRRVVFRVDLPERVGTQSVTVRGSASGDTGSFSFNASAPVEVRPSRRPVQRPAPSQPLWLLGWMVAAVFFMIWLRAHHSSS
ncbi:MAG: NEW3 domain-containing protein [Candidatus Nanohaloarchaea archaeon]|nr:NEW3 domain-containing protein [Candidatus Nanohaloarchaea archaeon]